MSINEYKIRGGSDALVAGVGLGFSDDEGKALPAELRSPSNLHGKQSHTESP